MDAKEYELVFLAENSHWWYEGMALIMQAIVDAYYMPVGKLRILDAGCGTGATMAWLARYGTVTGFDMSSHAIHFSRRRKEQNLAMASVMAMPFPDETFDLVMSLDVLYFVNIDDDTALQECTRVLVPGGRLIVRVPAFDWLRGVHDVKVSTGHRYTLRELSRKIRRGRLQPEHMSYANTLLFPLIALKRFCERWLPLQTQSDTAVDMGYLGWLLKWCLVLESRLVTKWSLPFGVSVIGIARK